MDFTVSWNAVFFFKDFLDLNFENFPSLSGQTQTSSSPLIVAAFIESRSLHIALMESVEEPRFLAI